MRWDKYNCSILIRMRGLSLNIFLINSSNRYPQKHFPLGSQTLEVALSISKLELGTQRNLESLFVYTTNEQRENTDKNKCPINGESDDDPHLNFQIYI